MEFSLIAGGAAEEGLKPKPMAPEPVEFLVQFLKASN